MKTADPKTIYLRDYQVPSFLIEKTDLVFELEEDVTTVTSTLSLRRHPDAKEDQALVLDGQELDLVSVSVDGVVLDPAAYTLTDKHLQLNTAPDTFELSCVTKIKPQENTSLEGLYKSSGMYCTQCEAEGFRKITYYLDRPDVMSIFTVTIIAEKNQYPVLLSNGNCIDKGELENGRHWAQWHDPFKKPAYLFALVAGQLSYIEDSFITQSEREVTLRIYVEDKDLDKCDHAMDSLKRSMRWDEDVYGREYDLDIFMIVAVDDFNMGAMENKGLNIFNTACVLANKETTTDVGFQRVEGVVAHEYFHNWSGNRVTCRDWFQLSLKEGFTVFRDQVFSADMGSPVVKRIEDVSFLRTLQFAEDAGPMAHPVQPPSFIEISNFYTLTVYEKGAEIVRMLHTLLGEEQFRAGSDLYFERHDGEAVTINEFVAAMETASDRDLSQFKRWYTQAGTPLLNITDEYDEAEQRYTLKIKQIQPDTPEAKGSDKLPLHIPLALGLVGEAGCLPLHPQGYTLVEQADNTHWILELNEAEKHCVFEKVIEKPVPSLLRNFSAPVKIDYAYSRDDYLRLMQSDDDAFNRWDASQGFAVSILHELMSTTTEKSPSIDSRFVDGLSAVLADADVANKTKDSGLDKAMIAAMLTLPSEAYMAEIAEQVDVHAIHNAREALLNHLALSLESILWGVYQGLSVKGEYSISAQSIAERSLKNTTLAYLMQLDNDLYHQACIQQYYHADNMTDRMAAFKLLVHTDFSALNDEKKTVLDDFYTRWKSETLVVNQWLSVQASVPSADTLQGVKALLSHPAFSLNNPNKVRSLISVFANNPLAFHREDGLGYTFLRDKIIELNIINPQIASRLLTPLTRWRQYLPAQQTMMKAALEHIKDSEGLSPDVFEVVNKSLAD